MAASIFFLFPNLLSFVNLLGPLFTLPGSAELGRLLIRTLGNASSFEALLLRDRKDFSRSFSPSVFLESAGTQANDLNCHSSDMSFLEQSFAKASR